MNAIILEFSPEPGFAGMYGATTMDHAIRTVRVLSKGSIVKLVSTGKETLTLDELKPGEAAMVECNSKRFIVVAGNVQSFASIGITEVDPLE